MLGTTDIMIRLEDLRARQIPFDIIIKYCFLYLNHYYKLVVFILMLKLLFLVFKYQVKKCQTMKVSLAKSKEINQTN